MKEVYQVALFFYNVGYVNDMQVEEYIIQCCIDADL